ncbi:M1 family aminopeptidase [Candidatus Amoebophilus asiaticus]|nr:M1 family aminopeptidase [Candidatus Amoebophilus asiaticus]
MILTHMPKRLLNIPIFILITFACFWGAFNPSIAGAVNLNAKPGSQQTSITYQPAATKLHDLIHTKLEIKFDWEKQQLHGTATIQVKPHFYPQSQLVLDARDFIIHSVIIVDNEEKKGCLYSYDNQQLTISLGHLYTRDDSITVEIDYTTQSMQGRPKYHLKPGINQGIYFIDEQGENKASQIWTQGEPNTNSYWFPTIDAPNQRCTQEMYITVEDRFKTLSNGVLIYTTLNDDQTRTDYWRMDLPHPPYLFMLAVGEFAEVVDEWNDIPVTYYVEPAYEKHAKNIFGHTTEMLDFFSEKLDYPYPWPKYSQMIVRDYFTGAMENTTAVILTEAIQGDERDLLDKVDRDEIIAHELCHHWFGNLVTCESWSQLLLNESLASIGTHLWYDYKYGPYERDRLIAKSMANYLEEAQLKQVSVVRDCYTYPIELFDCHTYHKGTLVMHMLRTYLGEEAFLQSLSQYLKKYAFSATDMHQLRKAFEEVSGQDLNWFFNQWFLSSGHPVLRIEHTYANGRLILKVWQKQARPSPVYWLPLAIDVWIGGKKERYHITVDKTYQEFTWPVAQQPELVYVDRNYLLVGEIDHPQTVQSSKYLYKRGEDFFSKYEAIKYFSNNKVELANYCNFFKRVLRDDYWGFKVIAMEAIRNYGRQEKIYSALEEDLIALSEDPHSLVREAVLHTLGTSQSPDKYTDIYKNALEDPSYRVANAALYTYANYSKEDQAVKEAIIENFEDYNDINIITTLATYYANAKQPDKYDWLKGKTDKLYTQLGFESLLSLLVKYTTAVIATNQQEDTLALLQSILENNPIPRIYLAAYDALQNMPRTRNVKKLLNETKK